MSNEKDYLLGTHDEEIERLGLQHSVWRPRTLDAWRRAGITRGQTILDVGCGPGYAACDLAEIVGPGGRVIAIDRSRRFLDALGIFQAERRLANITSVEQDLDDSKFPELQADGAWTRWVFAFVKHPRELLARVAERLKPGAPLVVFEYCVYSTWGLAPRLPELEEFVKAVMESWRADGGEPDIGRQLPQWLTELNFEIKSLNPIVDVVPKTNYVWQWPAAFLDVGIKRLVDINRLSPERGLAIREAFAAREADPHALMITPVVLEIIAVKR
jgi:SAM-dependent methyltransferase